MVTATLLCAAVLCWPTSPASKRLRALTSAARRAWRPPRPSSITLTCAAATTGWLVAGIPGAAAATLATATVRRRWRARTAFNHTLTTTDALAEAVHTLASALRSGAHPADAATVAATDAHPAAAAPMRAIAAAARLNGDLDRALAATSTEPQPGLRRVSRAWVLAQRHGLPLADLLDTTARDLTQRARFARQVHARMAGPRASATALAALPLLGIAVGEVMGAHPLRLLTTTGAGQALLLAGVTLQCVGLAWCGRLTNQVVSR